VTAILAVANGDEQKLTAFSATVCCSAEAVVHESTRIRPQWIGYRSLGGNSIERRISELLTGRKRHTAVIRPLTSE